ncbi:MAG: PDZ domain-containing protein [Planctomycetes bacterium]|nr:PDZ domain-containing protein [Planctomycetota bacterium]
MKRSIFILICAVTIFSALTILLAATDSHEPAENITPAAASVDQDQTKYSRRTPIVEAFDKNKDAVVSISGRQLSRRSSIFMYFDEWGFSRPQVRATPFLGSGFIVDPRGYIVTNAHVVEDAVEITVTLADGSEHQGKTIVADASVDLALIKIETDRPLPQVTFRNRDDLMIGETVLAIGNPFGLQHTLTDGIVSAIHHDTQIESTNFPKLIQLSAPINPGNSGGPLLNINGEVIGINTAIRRSAQAIGFAIPIDVMRSNLPVMLNKELELQRRLDFGLWVSDIQTTESTDELPPDAEQGILVRSVRAESAAAAAGFQAGDLIKQVDGKRVNSAIDFYLSMLERDVPSEVKFDVSRNQDTIFVSSRTDLINIDLPLKARPKPDGKVLAKRLFGLEVDSLNNPDARQRSNQARSSNIVVKSVEADSPADQAQIETGDMLVSVDGVSINQLEDLGLQLEMISSGSSVELILIGIRRTALGQTPFQMIHKIRAR